VSKTALNGVLNGGSRFETPSKTPKRRVLRSDGVPNAGTLQMAFCVCDIHGSKRARRGRDVGGPDGMMPATLAAGEL
jgi:hypothetical protein